MRKQITNNKSNWNLYECNNAIYSIAIVDGCGDSFFSKDIKHVITLIYKYGAYKKEDFTPYGLELIYNYLNKYNYTLKEF